MKMHRLIPAILFLTTLAAGADPATYPVKINRPFKAGDAYDVHATFEGTDSSTATLPGKPPQKEDHKYSIDFTARCDVKEVDAFGAEEVFSLTIEKLAAGPDGKVTMDAGKIIDIKRDDKDMTVTLRGGGDLPEDVQKAIEFIYSPLNPSGITDDDVMGSPTPRKVLGEAWPINNDNAVKQAANSVVIDPKHISGTTTLKGVEDFNGVRAVRVATAMSFANARPITLPKEVTVDSSDFKVSVGSLLPLDPDAAAD